jgi:hypothetical protein
MPAPSSKPLSSWIAKARPWAIPVADIVASELVFLIGGLLSILPDPIPDAENKRRSLKGLFLVVGPVALAIYAATILATSAVLRRIGERSWIAYAFAGAIAPLLLFVCIALIGGNRSINWWFPAFVCPGGLIGGLILGAGRR